jgi:uncharacterized protein involved in exopolysaccharide biosynthesis
MLDSTRNEGIDVRELANQLWQGRRWVISSLLLCALAMTVVAFVKTPTYRARTVLVPVSAEGDVLSSGAGSALGQLGGLASLAGINLGGHAAGVEEALAILKSRQFTESFIDRYQLLPILFDKKWNDQEGKWREGVEQPTLTKGFIYFDKNVRSVEQDKKTGLVTLEITWKNRDQAATWANNLIEQLNAEMRVRAIDKSNASVAYLEKELESTNLVASRDAINRLIEAQIKQRMLANVTKEYSFRVVEKALLPDPIADRAGPGKAVLIAAGALGGLVLGAVIVLIGASIAPPRRH